MSKSSTLYTSASISITVVRNETISLVDDVKKYDTTKLIDFLRREKDLELSEKAFEILKTQEINGCAFLKTSKEEFQGLGLGFGPAKNLADFTKEYKNKKLKAFSTYRNLKKVLAKYK